MISQRDFDGFPSIFTSNLNVLRYFEAILKQFKGI